ncbi:MAG: hypothetical protein QM756_21400 [Polyangiaceae bacterium]
MGRETFAAVLASLLVGCSTRAHEPVNAPAPLNLASLADQAGTSDGGSANEAADAGQPKSEKRATAAPPASLEELVERGLAAIRSGDAAAYAKLFVINPVTQQHCPEVWDALASHVDEAEQFIRARVTECRELIDWSNAREVKRTFPAGEKPADYCGGQLFELGDVFVEFDVLGEVVEVKLDDVIRVGQVYMFADDPRCRKRRTP